MPKTALLLLALAAGTLSAAPSASAACGAEVQAPSVWTVGGYGSGGPHVDACGGSCATVVSTPAQSVPGVVAVGSASVNNCL